MRTAIQTIISEFFGRADRAGGETKTLLTMFGLYDDTWSVLQITRTENRNRCKTYPLREAAQSGTTRLKVD